MDQRRRPPLFCGNQWDWILKVFSGASAPLVNTALCHKCILYTQTHMQTHMQTHKHFQFLFPSQTSPFSTHPFWCSSSPQLNLPHFPLFSHPVFLSASPPAFRNGMETRFLFKKKNKKNSAHTFFLRSSSFSFSFYLDLSFCRSATGVYQHWLVNVLLWLSHIRVISLQLRKVQWLLGDLHLIVLFCCICRLIVSIWNHQLVTQRLKSITNSTSRWPLSFVRPTRQSHRSLGGRQPASIQSHCTSNWLTAHSQSNWWRFANTCYLIYKCRLIASLLQFFGVSLCQWLQLICLFAKGESTQLGASLLYSG